MNIVLVGPVYPYRGGIAHYTTMLAQTLAKRGSQFHVVSFRRQYKLHLSPHRIPSKPLRIISVPQTPTPDPDDKSI